MCEAILTDLMKIGSVEKKELTLDDIEENILDLKAKEIALSRDYPASLAKRTMSKH